jgi:hypothetical protein
LSDRKFITVYEHPVFAPHAVPPPPQLVTPSGARLPTLGEVLFLPPNDLAKVPLGYVNLLCATVLPDTAGLDIPLCVRTLNEWAAIVRRETERQMYKFRRDPADYENSDAYFRALVMITVLQRDLGVKYDPSCINVREFKSSREGFIHGVLTGDRTGTCANMPVLYAAVGRIIGYPIYLVAAKGHFFCRWHNARTGERFNIEASGRGLTTPTDDHYTRWPKPVTEQEVHLGIYLRNLDPAEELGHFMATRGHCLLDKGHVLDAIVAYTHAHRLAPADPTCFHFLLRTLNHEIDLHQDGKLPSSYRQAEMFNQEGGLPLARYTLDDRYGERAVGVHLNGDQPGRLAPND